MTGSYLFALGVVALVMGGAFALMRMAQARGLSLAQVSPIRVLGQQSLGMGASVVLVDVDGARVLVGVSKAGISFLPSRLREGPGVGRVSRKREGPPLTPPVNGRGTELHPLHPEHFDNATSFSAVLKRAGSWK